MKVKKKQHPVAITGLGIVSSLGVGVNTFRDALRDGKTNFTRSLAYPILSFPVIGAFIPEVEFKRVLPTFRGFTQEHQQKIQKIARSTPRYLQLGLLASLEAWQHASLPQFPADPTRIGIVAAAQNTSTHYQYDLYNEFQKNPDFLSPGYALHFMDTDYVGVISEVLGIRGEGFTVGGASATGNVALLRGYRLIRDEWQDICVVVSALADLSPMDLQGFHNLGALGGHRFADEPNKACRPFDAAHEGFIYGQGTACIILESALSAQKRKVPILGYLLGGSLSLDANHLSNPSFEGEIRVMQEAMQSAGVAIEDINYINTHGTSAPLGDQVELDAIEKLLGDRTKEVMINSTKGITGHCLWSAGLVEAIATLIQMQEGFVHPNMNLEHPISLRAQLVKNESKSFQINIALSNGFGFGGINTSLILGNIKL